jgi:hypothetical protein
MIKLNNKPTIILIPANLNIKDIFLDKYLDLKFVSVHSINPKKIKTEPIIALTKLINSLITKP